MWTSINSIQNPGSLKEAAQLAARSKTALLAGGTYLAAWRDPAIEFLVDINQLLTGRIEAGSGNFYCGAGTTLQEIVNYFSSDDKHHLAAAARWSCVSKNIRNRRTIGGELARGRSDSELLLLLKALDARPEFYESAIITGLNISLTDLNGIHLERFGLLQSAPAFVITVAVKRSSAIKIAIGGQIREPLIQSVPVSEFDDRWISDFSASAGASFAHDHVGTRSYKQSVIQVGLQRIRRAL